jgi:hypothetical protein
MPKIDNTRKQRAIALLQRLRRGPSLATSRKSYSPKEAEREFSFWLTDTISLVIDIVPELQRMRKDGTLPKDKT